jgi:hypothetical protein
LGSVLRRLGPELPELGNLLFPRVARNNRRGDGPNRGAHNPIRLLPALVQDLEAAGVIGPERIAAAED